MADEKHPNDIIDEAIQSLAGVVNQEGSVCTGWVLVSQWSTVEGGQAMAYQVAHNTATWTQRGLLSEALSDLGVQGSE
jgi:hypothetical protein